MCVFSFPISVESQTLPYSMNLTWFKTKIFKNFCLCAMFTSCCNIFALNLIVINSTLQYSTILITLALYFWIIRTLCLWLLKQFFSIHICIIFKLDIDKKRKTDVNSLSALIFFSYFDLVYWYNTKLLTYLLSSSYISLPLQRMKYFFIDNTSTFESMVHCKESHTINRPLASK
mgnify:CR=1 FL=1